MAYKAKQENKETKGSSRIDVECNKLIYNDITITKISFYPINKKGLLAKCQVVLNDTLVLDEILITENNKFVKEFPYEAFSNIYNADKDYRDLTAWFHFPLPLFMKSSSLILSRYLLSHPP